MANGRALRRGEFCQSEAVERLQLLGSDGRDIKDGNLTIVCWDLQHFFFNPPKQCYKKKAFIKHFPTNNKKPQTQRVFSIISYFSIKKRGNKNQNVSQKQIFVR